jgi:hypothetical protein
MENKIKHVIPIVNSTTNAPSEFVPKITIILDLASSSSSMLM